MDIQQINIDELKVAPTNVRKARGVGDISSLKASIDAHGLIQPLTVVKNGKGYNVIAGQRRLKAMKELVKQSRFPSNHTIACVVSEADEHTQKEISLAENVARKDLDPLEEAATYNSLVNKQHTVEDIAGIFGVSADYVRQRRLISKAPSIVKDLVKRNLIPVRVAGMIGQLGKERRAEVCSSIIYHEAEDHFEFPWWMETVKQADDVLFGTLPVMAAACFKPELYTGPTETDLFGTPDETFCSDVEQFMELQKAAAQTMATGYEQKGWGWVKYVDRDSYFYIYDYQHEPKATPNADMGVIILMQRDYSLSVRTGMKAVNRQSAYSTSAAGLDDEGNTIKKQQPELTKATMASLNTVRQDALRLAVYEDKRVALEVLVVQLLTYYGAAYIEISEASVEGNGAYDLLCHAVTKYRKKMKTHPPKDCIDDLDTWSSDLTGLRVTGHRSNEKIVYKAVKKLSDAELKDLLCLISALGVQLEHAHDCEPLKPGMFDEVLAKDLKVDANKLFTGLDQIVPDLRNKETAAKVYGLFKQTGGTTINPKTAKLKEIKNVILKRIKNDGQPDVGWLKFPWKNYLIRKAK